MFPVLQLLVGNPATDTAHNLNVVNAEIEEGRADRGRKDMHLKERQSGR